jgi:(p)ppGpp synthase/HD superfamily hydrolase
VNPVETAEQGKPLTLTTRFTRAVDYARQVHLGWPKGTQVPYMAHLLGVASLVMGENAHIPFAVTEDMVIAALLHDALEDEGGLPRLRDIADDRQRLKTKFKRGHFKRGKNLDILKELRQHDDLSLTRQVG